MIGDLSIEVRVKSANLFCLALLVGTLDFAEKQRKQEKYGDNRTDESKSAKFLGWHSCPSGMC